MPEAIGYAITAALGLIVALSEILSRYRDAPYDAARSRAGWAYLAFNAVVAVLAFYLIREVFPLRDPPAEGEALAALQGFVTDIVLAGAGAMAVLRSSLFAVRVGDKDVQVGLAAIVDIFRNTIDRDVDRLRAGPRAEQVAGIMSQISFERAHEPLTSVTLNLLQNVSADERAQIEQKVSALASQSGRTDEGKALELGLILAGTVGFDVLNSAVEKLKGSITTGTTRAAVVSEAVERLSPAVILTELPATCLSMATDLPPEAQKALGEQIDLIAGTALSDAAKALNAGLLIANTVGEESFKAAVDLLETVHRPRPEEDANEVD